jgi:Xaa-Pro aminopeptidase
MTEFATKQERIQALLAKHGLDALLLKRVSSFAWATCGASSYVNTATTSGEASLLIARSGRHLITNNIEATRLRQEEKLADQGWQFHVAPWYEAQEALAQLTKGMKLGSDDPVPGALDLSHDLARLRANLTLEEGERFRELGRLCAEAIDSATRAVRPGQTECEIAARLGHEAERRGAQPVVNLIATDQRIFDFRHPLPTDKVLDHYAMMVLCGRRQGLICSVTRLVHFGRLTDELRLDATRPGQRLDQVFARATDAYAEAGFPDEWQWHHQGGPAGYEPREYIATPYTQDPVLAGQAYAWNPSIAGCKSEDTILVTDSGNEVLTAIDGWPDLPVAVRGCEHRRPAILEIV